MPVAALKADVDVQLAVYGKLSCHGVDLEGTEAQVDHVDPTQLLWFGDTVGLGRIEAVTGIHLRVSEKGQLGVVFALAAVGRREVDAREDLVALCPDLNNGFGVLWYGDEAVEGRQVGHAVFVGHDDAFGRDGVHQLALVTDGIDAEVTQLET